MTEESNNRKKRVLIVDDHPQYPDSLKKRSTKSRNAQVRLDFRYDGDTVDTVAHVVEVFGRFSCMP
jgi:hypothetical protein